MFTIPCHPDMYAVSLFSIHLSINFIWSVIMWHVSELRNIWSIFLKQFGIFLFFCPSPYNFTPTLPTWIFFYPLSSPMCSTPLYNKTLRNKILEHKNKKCVIIKHKFLSNWIYVEDNYKSIGPVRKG